MAGLSDYNAENALNWASGQQPYPAISNRFLALFTAAPTSDAGTGGTEVSTSGTAYARVQVAGAVAATAAFTTGSPNVTMTTNPGWVVPGMNVYDLTNSQQIGTVSTYVGTALVLTGNAAHASSGTTDSLQFSAFPAASGSTGTEPAVTPANTVNGAVISYAQSTASWGTVLAFGLYDAVTGGNLLWWDYLGNYPLLPAEMTAASPGVISAHAHGFSAGSLIAVSTKIGGTIPSFSQSNLTGILTVAAPVTTDSFTVTNASTAVNTSSSGDFMVRGVQELAILSASITASWAASTFTLSAA